MFLDSSATANPQNAVGAVTNAVVGSTTNTNLQLLYQSGKFGAIPMLGASEVSSLPDGNVIRLNPNSKWGQFQGRIFFVATNLSTNFTINLSLIRLGLP